MTLDRQKQLLAEIVSEYDLQTVIDALLLQHSLDEIEDALAGNPCPWEVESGKALADEVIAACQPND